VVEDDYSRRSRDGSDGGIQELCERPRSGVEDLILL
jgi:hypothetical protein